MTLRSRISAGTKALVLGPPWPVRVLGAVIVAVDVGWWIAETTPTAWLGLLIELGKHGTILLVGLTLVYPEGAARLMKFARQFPPLNRRSRRR